MSTQLQRPITQQARERGGREEGDSGQSLLHSPTSHHILLPTTLVAALIFVFSLLGFVFLHLTEKAGSSGTWYMRSALLSTHIRIMYSSNTFLGRDLFFVWIKCYTKTTT